MSTVKTCTTCKHFRPWRMLGIFPVNWDYSECESPTFGVDLVTGKPKSAPAQRMRRDYSPCGPAGHLWETKK